MTNASGSIDDAPTLTRLRFEVPIRVRGHLNRPRRSAAMTNRTWTMAASIVIGLLVGVSGMSSSHAQVPGFKRIEMQKQDVGATGREAVLARAEFDAGAVAPKHTHPGEEIGFILEGELTLEIDGKPPQKLKAGDSFFVPAGQVLTG